MRRVRLKYCHIQVMLQEEAQANGALKVLPYISNVTDGIPGEWCA